MTFGRDFGRGPTGKSYGVPTVMARAPINALRSHLYPVEPGVVGDAMQQMLDPAAMPAYLVLPIKMAQQQWKKMDRWSWQEWSGSADSYAKAFIESGSTLRTIRNAQDIPQLRQLQVIGQELTDQLMGNLIEEDPRRLNPELRNMQYPSAWGPESESFAVAAAPTPNYPMTYRQQQQYPRIMTAIENIRAQDLYYATFFGTQNNG